MNKLLIFIICILLLAISPVLAQSGGGGGVAPSTYTYSQCNELLNNEIEEYSKVTGRLDLLFTILATFFVIFLIYILIHLGMEVQRIKDKGFKKWWRENDK